MNTHPETPPAPPARPAATVILGRPARESFEVLLLKRHGKSGFMGGAHVFPGGRVDPTDEHEGPGRAFVHAAVRETREEAGIALDPATLTPYAWWITPLAEPKRFDTRFFIAEVAAGTVATIDEHEAVDSAWLSPRAALDAYANGTIRLAPPTLCTLEDLLPYPSVAQAQAAVRLPLAPICPLLLTEPEGLVLALPGDPLHEVKDPAFATRTRIVMDADGRFRSARG